MTELQKQRGRSPAPPRSSGASSGHKGKPGRNTELPTETRDFTLHTTPREADQNYVRSKKKTNKNKTRPINKTYQNKVAIIDPLGALANTDCEKSHMTYLVQCGSKYISLPSLAKTTSGFAGRPTCSYELRNVVMSFGSLLGTHQSSASWLVL